IVDSSRNFLTQRTDARIALIEAAYENGSLRLRAPNSREFHLPLDTPATGLRQGTVWRDTVQAPDLGDAVAAWFIAGLDKPCRLVRAHDEFERRLSPERLRVAQLESMPEVPVAFVDAFPLLVISEESLSHLNARLEEPLPMNRFRPNIVLRGAAPHAE